MNCTITTISHGGKVISQTQMTNPHYFSLSIDGFIYLTDEPTGLYQSADGGVSWSRVFNLTDEWQPLRVVKVTTGNVDNFWTLERSLEKNKSVDELDTNEIKHHLRVYSVERTGSDVTIKIRDVNLTTLTVHKVDLSLSSLTYDGYMNIFLSDFHYKAVYVLSVNGLNNCQLLSSHQIKHKPYALAVDSKSQLLYVGQKDSIIDVYKLTYGD